jgi:voltage-gated potassium channel
VPHIERDWGHWLHYFDLFSVGVFTIEYIARLWIAVEVPFLARIPPWKARWRFARRPYQIIDLLAILPFYVGHLFGLDLRMLRIFRLLRFLKLSRYSPAMHTLLRVISAEAHALTGAGILFVTAVLFASTGIYYIEHTAQPEKFGSIPEAMWWAVATLSTVGYGDVAPVTAAGRFFGGIIMVTGLCILALPVAILSTGFAQEMGRRNFVVTWSLMARVPILAELDAAQVEALMPLLHALTLPPNFEVAGHGRRGDSMYFIASGRVRMTTPAGQRMMFDTGDFFGMLSQQDKEVKDIAFVTTTKCRLLKLYGEEFHRLEIANPEVGTKIRRLANTHSSAIRELMKTPDAV